MQTNVRFITNIFILRKLYSRLLWYVYTAMDPSTPYSSSFKHYFYQQDTQLKREELPKINALLENGKN
jgi:hypothetical protein